jgi:phage terminase large subunit GpA-like protein
MRLRVWVNTALGETWEDRGGEAIEPDSLLGRRESFGEQLPDGVAVLTAGVDVQKDRLEVQVVGWGRDEESWVIEHRQIWGDPSGPAVWQDLDTLLLGAWRHPRDGADMLIRAACVDSGGQHTSAAYEFARRRMGRRVWAIKGRGGEGVKPWPRRASAGKNQAPVFIVGVDALKDALAARLAIAEPGPGFVHFSAGLDPEWFAQLTAERVRTRFVNGRPVRSWEPKRAGIRNEALDTYVYALAALHGLYAAGFKLADEAERMALMPVKGAPPVAQPAPPRAAPVRSKWLTR